MTLRQDEPKVRPSETPAMRLSFNVFGFEIAKIELDIPESSEPATVVDQGVKRISRLWVRHML